MSRMDGKKTHTHTHLVTSDWIFDIQPTIDAPEWYRKAETGAEVFMSAWSTKRVNETNARHAKELFATLPFELP